jgi:hypothetical protein
MKLSKNGFIKRIWNEARGHSSAFCCRFYQYEKVTEFGINPDNVFPWDWVGLNGVPLD